MSQIKEVVPFPTGNLLLKLNGLLATADRELSRHAGDDGERRASSNPRHGLRDALAASTLEAI